MEPTDLKIETGKPEIEDAETGEPGSNALPFFHHPKPLDRDAHRGLKLDRSKGYGFARTSFSVPLAVLELSMAARHYPIVFSSDEDPTPLAVLGLRPDENLFVNAVGAWRKNVYIPAHIRRYPFIFMEAAEGNRLILCVDEEAEHLTGGDGQPLFLDDGPAPLLDEVMNMLVAFQNGHHMARDFGRALQEQGLLAERRTDVTLASGETAAIQNFRMINEEKFGELPDTVFLDWRKQGWLPLVYFHLQSMNNWGSLVDLAVQEKSHA